MSLLPVLLAVRDPTWEAEFLAMAQQKETGLIVVRRCLDLADLLAAAATATAQVALVDAGLARLDAEALSRLLRGGVVPVLRVPTGPAEATEALGHLPAPFRVSQDAPPQAVAAVLRDAASTRICEDSRLTWSSTMTGLPRPGDPTAPVAAQQPPAGRVLAVWGPTGAPGRTLVAVNVAAELAESAVPTLLVDADVYGASIAQQLGLLDEAPGLAAAARQAGLAPLEASALGGFARQVAPGLSVLTGIARAERWPELRPAAVDQVVERARSIAAWTVIDCGFCLERDDELAFDTPGPRRNGTTLACLAAADVVLAVGGADPVGLYRLIRGLAELRSIVPAPRVVVNKARQSVGGGPHGEA
ncbi:MAG: AAA family ATPase, partial [Mycobacteriales bacterium]